MADKYEFGSIREDNCLTVMNGAEDGRVFRLEKDFLSIGKSESNDIPLKTDRSIVATHAFLLKEEDKFYICMNDKKKALISGDIFKVGFTELKINY